MQPVLRSIKVRSNSNGEGSACGAADDEAGCARPVGTSHACAGVMSAAPSLRGKVAVVTGGGSGIGRATALLLARRGARVHVADLQSAAAEEVARAIEVAGGSAAAHALDVSDPEAVEAFAETVFAREGHVDILHNNAGIGHAGNIEATTVGDWQRVIGVNLLGVAYGVQAFIPRMLLQGRPASVVNTASMAGLWPAAKLAPYCASKYGVVGLSEALNAELSKRGIHVTAICPGIIDTPIVSTGIMRGDLAEMQGQAASFYAKHGASPDEVAQAILKAIEERRLIVPVPRRQVTLPYLLHRISPRLVQPLARNMERIVKRG
jgi:NAD(P)-dependent dehydrogenase (short-subunit alcohol dehydrogenase family)